MKKKISALLALLFFWSVLPGLPGWAAAPVVSNLLVKGHPYVDVKAMPNFAYTDVPIQAAFDNHVGGNATVYIPAGKYIIGTELLWNAVDNITIRGDGIGRTILDASALQDIPKRAGLAYNRTWGVLSINPMNMDTGIDAYHYNVVIEGITIIGSTLIPATSVYQKLLVWSTTNNVTFRNCEFIGAYYEAVYGTVSTGKTMTDQTVENCIFRNNVTGNMYNINTGISVENVRIINNIFDNGWTAINVLGKSTKIRGNTLINMRGYSMQLGDGDSAATKGHEGYEITHNTWRGLGSGAVSGATVFGIGLFTSTLHHTDNSAAQGNIIANNNFIDSVSPPGVGAVIPISVQGNALVSNNLISGITTLGTGTSDIAITAKYASGASGFQRVSLLNNVVEDTPISRAGGKGWNFGIFVAGGDNAVYHLGGNKVAGIHSGGYAFFTGVFPSQPIVTFDGEVYNGNVGTNTALKNFDFGADTTHYNTPIYGDLLHGLRTAISDDIRGTTIIDHSQLSDNSTTPSVAGGKIWYSNNTNPTSITAFPDAVQGQVITIMFYDNNTTIVAGASMKLQGAVNFVATPNDTITLFYGFQGKWYEVSRSVN